MKYRITQKAVDDGVYDEIGEIEIIAAVPEYINIRITEGYLFEIPE